MAGKCSTLCAVLNKVTFYPQRVAERFHFTKNIQRTCTSSEQLVTSVYQTLVSVDGWWTFRVSGRGVLVCVSQMAFSQRPPELRTMW